MNKDLFVLTITILFLLARWIFDFSSETTTTFIIIIGALIIANWIEDLVKTMVENNNARTHSLKIDLENIKTSLYRIEDNLKKL